MNEAPAQTSVEAAKTLLRLDIERILHEDMRTGTGWIVEQLVDLFERSALSPPPTVGAEDESAVTVRFGYAREPEIISWNVLPKGEHRLYTRPSPSPVDVKGVAQAMADRRLELINEPLARIWEELAKVAICSCIASEKGGL